MEIVLLVALGAFLLKPSLFHGLLGSGPAGAATGATGAGAGAGTTPATNTAQGGPQLGAIGSNGITPGGTTRTTNAAPAPDPASTALGFASGALKTIMGAIGGGSSPLGGSAPGNIRDNGTAGSFFGGPGQFDSTTPGYSDNYWDPSIGGDNKTPATGTADSMGGDEWDWNNGYDSAEQGGMTGVMDPYADNAPSDALPDGVNPMASDSSLASNGTSAGGGYLGSIGLDD